MSPNASLQGTQLGVLLSGAQMPQEKHTTKRWFFNR
nr:MAG TPA: hypothetical protein [Caudoviricetes sp.]